MNVRTFLFTLTTENEKKKWHEKVPRGHLRRLRKRDAPYLSFHENSFTFNVSLAFLIHCNLLQLGQQIGYFTGLFLL